MKRSSHGRCASGKTHFKRSVTVLWQAPTVALSLMLMSCGGDPVAENEQIVAEMTQRVEAVTRAESVDGVIPRFNQPKTVACLTGEFKVREDIPDNLKHGLFMNAGSYPAMLRIGNASRHDDSKRDIRGLSIKVSAVEGPVLWGEPGSQDFILNSYPSLFVATPEEFLAFARARQEDKKLRFFLSPFNPHIKSLITVLKARKKHNSPLDIRYWSTVPYKLGETTQQVVKYSVTPCSGYSTRKAVDPGKNQLRAAIKSHLAQAPACFDFGVQLQLDENTMPIEDASIIWDEEASPFLSVATLTMEDQVFDDAESLNQCEQSSFNPWQSLAAHEPLGRMNAVRKAIYEQGAELRNQGRP